MMTNAGLTATWKIDGKVDLTKACTDAHWHLATAIETLIAQGIERADAEAFAAFIFNEAATVSACRSEDLVTDEQWERLGF